jgi:hypothetical protein
MAETKNPIVVDLPEGLRRQFAHVSRRLWSAETAMAGCVAVGALVLSYLGLFLSDRCLDTPVWLRLTAGIAGLGAVLSAGYWWTARWLLKPRDSLARAVHVQRFYRRLGDRLLGVVELADERARPADFSPALYRAAIQQVAAEAAEFDFGNTVNLRPAKSSVTALLGLLALSLLPLLLVPAAGWNSFRRWIAPTAAIDRYTLVALEELPRQQIVPHGEPFDVECAVRYRSFWRPTRAFCRYAGQDRIEATVQGGRLRFRVPGQTQRGLLRVQLGDAQRQLPVLPTYRPSLQQLSATIDLPKYLGYSPVDEEIQTGSLAVLEGSRVAFQGKASRALTAAGLEIGDQKPQPLAVQGDTFSSAALELGAASACVFTWRDQLGLDNSVPWRLAIQPRKDAPPEPELPDLQRENSVLATDVIEVKAVARDDFGVRDLGLNWDRASDSPATNRSARQTFLVPAESRQQRQLQETFRFSPALLNIPPDTTIELQAWARDFFPGRPPATTPVYRVYVLGNAQHAEMVRANLESLLSHLEEVTRLEEKIAGDTRELKDRDKPAADDTASRLAQTAAEQTRNATMLDQIAQGGGKLLLEAMKNPAFSEDTLREWTRKFQDLQGLARGPMPRAAGTLQSAGQSPASRADKLAEALKTEAQILAALAQMQQQVNQSLDQLQALTLAQRLRNMGATEKEIGGQLQQIVPETIGLLPKELPDRFAKTQTALTGQQDKAQAESEVLQGEISRFFERTQKENYGQVSHAMAEAHTRDELDRLRGLIQANISMDAMQNLTTWSARFNEWADKLEPPQHPDAGGGGEGGGQSGPNPILKELLALLRLRDGDTRVRQQTGLVDRQRADSAAYPAGVHLLSTTQQQLSQTLRSVQDANQVTELDALLRDGQSAMQQVQSLLDKPQTDQPTDQAEVRTINLLSDAINLINEQAQQQSGQAGGSSADIAFLMQMMALRNAPSPNAGQFGGGNTAGGTTDRVPPSGQGDAAGKRAETRNVRKATGATISLPTEFRDALENYFHGLEQKTP